MANNFYKLYKKNNRDKNKNLIPIFFNLINKENINRSLYSHIKIDNISFYTSEKEILFLPFTSFEILKIIPKEEKEKDKKKTISNKKNVEYYEIELTYLGNYRKELENIEKEEKIPDTEYKQSLEESNLIEIKKDITNKNLIDKFNEYEKSFKKNNEDIYIIYDVNEKYIDKDGYVSIFGKNDNQKGSDFVKENKNKIKIIINNKEKPLEYTYKLKKGYNKIIIKLNDDNDIYNLEYMFSGCTCLKSIEGLKNFSCMFYHCLLLSDIKALENWDVSNVKDFSCMFSQSNSLFDIKPLQNWNVLNGNDFTFMFNRCELLSDIKPLENWDVSNGIYFRGFFKECKSLSSVKPLENWNVSNGIDFSYLFYECFSLLDLKGLEKWNVSNGNNFDSMFYICESLSDIKSLQNWNVLKVNNFSNMFGHCKLLSDIKPLQNWNVSEGKKFSNMFWGCESLSDVKPLQNWDVSKAEDFSLMFCQCKSLSDIKPLEKWDVSNGKNFFNMFDACDSLTDRTPIQKWNTHGFNPQAIFGDIKCKVQ